MGLGRRNLLRILEQEADRSRLERGGKMHQPEGTLDCEGAPDRQG